jgi:hypothetical protein
LYIASVEDEGKFGVGVGWRQELMILILDLVGLRGRSGLILPINESSIPSPILFNIESFYCGITEELLGFS